MIIANVEKKFNEVLAMADGFEFNGVTVEVILKEAKQWAEEDCGYERGSDDWAYGVKWRTVQHYEVAGFNWKFI